MIQILRERLLSPPQMTDLEDISIALYPTPLPLAMDITPEEAEPAIRRPKTDKAPGVNRILNRFLRQVLEVFLPHFTHLFQECADLGYHPKEFRIANTIVSKKPRKEDYSLAESYRPIASLNAWVNLWKQSLLVVSVT